MNRFVYLIYAKDLENYHTFYVSMFFSITFYLYYEIF